MANSSLLMIAAIFLKLKPLNILPKFSLTAGEGRIDEGDIPLLGIKILFCFLYSGIQIVATNGGKVVRKSAKVSGVEWGKK